MVGFFTDGAKIDKKEFNNIIDSAAWARMQIFFTGEKPQEYISGLKKTAEMNILVKIAAGEGALEFAERRKKGKRTWPMSRWVDESLATLIREAKEHLE